LAGLVSYHFSSQFRVPPHEPPPAPAGSFLGRIRHVVAIVRSEPAFLRYSARQLVYVVGARLVLPLVPLYYVRVVGAPDAWIGIIATVQSLALLVGYLFWRRESRLRGTRFVLLATILVSALYPALLSLVDQLIVVAALAGAWALFAAGVDLVLFDELMKTIPRRFGVTFASVDTTLVNLATIAAPLVGAALAELLGIETALRIGTLVSLAGCVLFVLAARRPRSDAGPARVAAG
jgi:predicted MFS family arabinose efflux permease